MFIADTVYWLRARPCGTDVFTIIAIAFQISLNQLRNIVNGVRRHSLGCAVTMAVIRLAVAALIDLSGQVVAVI